MRSWHIVVFCIGWRRPLICFFFFFNDTATTEIYTLSLHDALPISTLVFTPPMSQPRTPFIARDPRARPARRSEEHTSELQSPCNLVCRLLLEKKKKATRGRPSELLLAVRPRRSREMPAAASCGYS